MSEDTKITDIFQLSYLVNLHEERENFPNIINYLRANQIRPSSLFLPQTLKKLDEDLALRDSLIFEAIDFYDLISFYSIFYFKDSDYIINQVINIIIQSRTTQNASLMIAKTTIDDFIFSSAEEAHEFLISNKWLIAIYVFSLLEFVFFS